VDPTDRTIRLECIRASAAIPGNPNHVQRAQEFYDFVMAGPATESASDTASTDTTKPSVAKGAKK
jgi:hypothetical protein